MSEVPPEVAAELANARLLPEYRQFLTSYPTVTAAVAAAERGEDVVLETDVHLDMVRRVLIEDGTPLVETRVYPPRELHVRLKSAYLNAKDRPAAEKALLNAMPALLPSQARCPAVYAVSEHHGSPMPRFGYAYVIKATMHTWREFEDAVSDTGGVLEDVLCHALDGDTPGLLPDRDVAAHLAHYGLSAPLCKGCDEILTQGHPSWPGVWVYLGGGEQEGVLCPSYTDPYGYGHLSWEPVGGPHVPDLADSGA
jgi:hypothetical protein